MGPMRASLAALLALLLLAGCARGTSTATSSPTASLALAPITNRAVAAVAAEYVDDPSYATTPTGLETFGEGAAGATLRFGADDATTGDALRIVVAPSPGASVAAECAKASREGGTCSQGTENTTLIWHPDKGEEGAGFVALYAPRETGYVLVHLSGPFIEADPRQQDLVVSVDDMLLIALDPRLNRETLQQTVDAGAGLALWRDDGQG